MKRIILAIFMAITLGVTTTGGVVLATGEDETPTVTEAEAKTKEEGDSSVASGDGACNDSYNILGMVPWYKGLTEEVDGKCEVSIEKYGLEKSIGVIIGNVSSDLFQLVAYLAVAYIMYSGYMYMTAMGDPGKAAKAQKGMTSAIVGMMIALLASSVVRFVMGTIFGIGDNKIYQGSANVLIKNILEGVYGMAGIVAVCMIIYGGVTFATSAGDPNKTKRGKMVLLYSTIGLVVVLLAWAITNFVLKQMGL